MLGRDYQNFKNKITKTYGVMVNKYVVNLIKTVYMYTYLLLER